MFIKLSQHSTAWWVCVAITCVFGASLLTVLVYPVYADNDDRVCRRDLCAGGCGPCAGEDGLGPNGWYEIESRVTGDSDWVSGGQCWGRVSTYHRTDIKNDSGGDVFVSWNYLALFRQPNTSRDACIPSPSQPPLNEDNFTVADGQRRTNTYTQSQTYRLGLPEAECDYEAQAVTEVTFPSGDPGDTQGTGDQFKGCD